MQNVKQNIMSTIHYPIQIQLQEYFSNSQIKLIEAASFRSYAVLTNQVLTWGKTCYFINQLNQKSHFNNNSMQKEPSSIYDIQMNQSQASQIQQYKIKEHSSKLNQSQYQVNQESQLQNSPYFNLNNSNQSQCQSIMNNHNHQNKQNYQLKMIPVKVNHIAAGLQHTYGYYFSQSQSQQTFNTSQIKNSNSGKVYCWGSNVSYQLGLQEQNYYGLEKMDLFGEAFQKGCCLRQISCGERHTIAILDFFKEKSQSQEDGSTLKKAIEQKYPKQHEQQQKQYKSQQQQQQSQSLAKDVKLFVWGQSKSYQLTLDTTLIVPYPVMSECINQNIEHIYSKSDFNIALLQNGEAYSWGSNMFNRLGLQTKINKSDYEETIKKKTKLQTHKLQNSSSQSLQKVRIPRQVKINQKITKIGIGVYHAIAITEAGQGYSWGSGLQGQLGTNKFCCQAQPTKICINSQNDKTKAFRIIQVSCGQHHSLILDNENKIYSCGSNSHGCLGHQKSQKSHNQKKKRCKVFELIDMKLSNKNDKIVKISSGYRHNLALSNEGKLFGWGSNQYSQIIPINQHSDKVVEYKLEQIKLINTNQKQEKSIIVRQKLQNEQSKKESSFQSQYFVWKMNYQQFKKDTQLKQENFMAQLQLIVKKYNLQNRQLKK